MGYIGRGHNIDLTNQCTRIPIVHFYNDYVPAKKWVIVATTSSQSRDFTHYGEIEGYETYCNEIGCHGDRRMRGNPFS